jgi:hypothetical protein
VFQAIVAKQLDCNSRFLKITLVDFGVKIEVPETAKVTINANRPDGKSQSFMGVANNDGTITVPLAQWMLEVAGELKCDVSVINTTDNKRLTSTDFYVNVQEAANKSTDISENPDGEIRVITPTQKIDENSSDDEYPSAKAVYELDNITATASGKAITIDSAEAPLQNLKLYGKTTQDGTLGENILPYPYTTKTINGVTFTDLGDGRIQVSGTASADITYEFLKDATIDGLVVGRTYRATGCNCSATNINFFMSFSQTSGPTHEFYLLNGQEFTAVATSITGLTATLSVLAGQTINTTIHPKLEVASVDLVSVGDSGSFGVEVYGKNLLNVASSISFTGDNPMFRNVKCPLKKGVTYTLSFYTAVVNVSIQFTYTGKSGREYPSGADLKLATSGKTIYTFTPAEDVDVVRLYINATGVALQCMIEKGNSLTFYEECNKQTLTIPYKLPNENEIDFAKGLRVQKVKEFSLIDYISSCSQRDNTDYSSEILRFDFSYIFGSEPLSRVASNRFQYNYIHGNDLNVSRAREGISTHTEYDIVSVLIDKKRLSTPDVAGFTDYLINNETVVQVILATPIETSLTETELNAYRHLMTNKGTTTILNSDGADMEISHYINKPNAQVIGTIHSQINKDYLRLQQAIISTGGSTL